MARVSGTVLLNGEPVRKTGDVRGTVTFKPAGGGAAASGAIDASGRFRLSVGASQAIAPGAYTAAVRVHEVTPPAEPGGYPQRKPISAERYASPTTSGLSFEITPGANELEIALAD